MRQAPAALAFLFFVLHAAWSPTTLGDIDEVNFALGVQRYDVAAHQPHPPGYPVFVAAAKVSTAVLRAIGVEAPEVRGITWLSAVSGALVIPLLVALFRSLRIDPIAAISAAIVIAVTPLYWFTALRPLSDITGLACAVLAQALLVPALVCGERTSRQGTILLFGAVVAGLAIGVRSQNFLLTIPLLALALLAPRTGLTTRHRVLAIGAFAAGVLVWTVPMVIRTGGVDAYVAALGDQAGEDLVGAVIVWTHRTPRALADALGYTFLWPWGGIVAGAVVTALAVGGALRMLAKQRPALLVILVAYAPYGVFHLLFQETVMTRYALPILPPMALLAVYALAAAGRTATVAGATAFSIFGLAVSVPVSRVYGQEPSPGAEIVRDAFDASEDAVGMHAVMLRHEQWYHGNASARAIRTRHGREMLTLVDRWRELPETSVRFMADPRRTDLAMLDPRSRELVRSYGWSFPEMPFVSGARPNRLDLFVLRPPGWMLDQGWAVTAEVAGQSTRAGARPELRPSLAWVRSRLGETLLIIGGRNLGPPRTSPAHFVARIGDRVLTEWSSPPGFFLHRLKVPAGTFASAEAYVPLSVSASAPRAGEVGSLEQFDLQPEGVPMFGFVSGWQEPEYNSVTALAWRWMTAQAELWVRPIGRDVTLTLRAESPMRYFDGAPQLLAAIGSEVMAELEPSDDFTWTVVLPDRLLAAHDGAVKIQSDKWFVPGGAGGGDQRQLALRVFSVEVE